MNTRTGKRLTPAERERLVAIVRETDVSEGTKIAAEVRSKCNALTRSERDRLTQEGAKLIVAGGNRGGKIAAAKDSGAVSAIFTDKSVNTSR